MRIATSSIPRKKLSEILAHYVDPKNVDQRKNVVRLYLQAERYQDAQIELEAVIADFPDEAQLADLVQSLRQLHARSIVKEIEVRRKAGQHALALDLLQKFPVDGVAGETLQQVKELLDEYQETQKTIEKIHADLADDAASLPDSSLRRQCEAILAEIEQELSIATLDRMADYLRLSADPAQGAQQKLSLAISGWLLGANHAETNLSVALSLVKIRDSVARYMNEFVKLERGKLLDQIRGQEGASPALIAGLIANMKPPLATPKPSVATPGYYELEVPIGIDKEADVTSYVQLPPGYDPHVHYPTIVTLNGSGATAKDQVDWWAGDLRADGTRFGQASRLGYIVVSVDWLKPGQKEYEYSAREHAAVLVSLRDACRRFAIDTDRVFLSGHSIGGNAAWDLGLAHPDLWAGVIPIVAEADKYCAHYWENAKLVPFYVLAGELDGEKTKNNARDLDRYMNARYDVTVTEYIGRGHEDFYDDIQHIFDWMSRKQRNFFPKEFTVSTMRTWDNYFWWVEVRDFPAKATVEPVNWPPGPGVRPLVITGKVQANNGLHVASGSIKLTVWLSPELVDFSRPVPITFGSRNLNKGNKMIQPDLGVLLEDVRTRADRQHPFWAKVEQ